MYLLFVVLLHKRRDHYFELLHTIQEIRFECGLDLEQMACYCTSLHNHKQTLILHHNNTRKAVASWLVPSSLERAGASWVPALAGDMVLCFWTGYFPLTVPLSTQMYNDSVHSISLILLWNIEPKNYTSLVSKQTSEN